MSDHRITIGENVTVQASVQTLRDGWEGARQLPLFVLPGRALGLASWEGAARVAEEILFQGARPADVVRLVLFMTQESPDTQATVTRDYPAS